MQYHRHVFPPYTLYLANYIELVLCSISQVSPLRELLRWPLPAGLIDCEIKIINFFLQTSGDFCIFCTVHGYIRSRYNYNTLHRTQQSFLKIWLLFVLTLSRFIDSIWNKDFNKKLYYLREWLMSCGNHTP